MEIPQFLAHNPDAAGKRASPTMATAGAMVNGVMNLRTRPTKPKKAKVIRQITMAKFAKSFIFDGPTYGLLSQLIEIVRVYYHT